MRLKQTRNLSDLQPPWEPSDPPFKRKECFMGSSHKDSMGGGIHNSLSQSIDLAKLNPNCHMNYSNYL